MSTNSIDTVQNWREESQKPNLENAEVENAKLQLQLEAYDEVISKIREAVKNKQTQFEEQLQEMWSVNLKLVEEMSQFNDLRGISSPWWRQQIMTLQNPDISLPGTLRTQQLLELKKLKSESIELEVFILDTNNEIMKTKEKVLAGETMLAEMKRMKEELQQEPYGSEFLEMKGKIQRSKDTCLQLSALLAAKATECDRMSLENTVFQKLRDQN